jgi:alkanesulfonate monooxygenase SsuD/methylene tetrahydromethanopterin reductase-like flavin-dependent oxidoreductase (luciferase family)
MKVGILISLAKDAITGKQPSYADIKEMALTAEELGFDSIWVYDHLLYRTPGEEDSGIWECWTTLSALAEATKRVEIGSMVVCTAFRNPALLAKMAVTLDEISQGRFTLGLGAGWNKPDFEAFGYPYDHRFDRFEEALKIIVPLVREGHVDFEGKYYRAPNCSIIPRGPSPIGPKILIGGSGNRVMRLAAEYAECWNTIVGAAASFRPLKQKMLETLYQNERDENSLALIPWLNVIDTAISKKPNFVGNYIRIAAEEISRAIREYSMLGVEHIVFRCFPNNLSSIHQSRTFLEQCNQ